MGKPVFATQMNAVAVGDGDNDMDNEVYAASDNYHMYEFKYLTPTIPQSYSGNSDPIKDTVEVLTKPKGCLFEICGNNPVSTYATVKYSITKDTQVKLALYDASGKLVKNLLDGKAKTGSYTLTLDAKDFPSGIYLIRFKTDGFQSTKKLVLMH